MPDRGRFATRAIHGADAAQVEQRPASVPIYQTATWRFDAADEFADAMRDALPGAAAFYAETIANPLVTVPDLALLASMCREAGVPSVVDNTFASPALCNPISLGVDFVVHSATKYIGGHSDLIGGIVCGS